MDETGKRLLLQEMNRTPRTGIENQLRHAEMEVEEAQVLVRQHLMPGCFIKPARNACGRAGTAHREGLKHHQVLNGLERFRDWMAQAQAYRQSVGEPLAEASNACATLLRLRRAGFLNTRRVAAAVQLIHRARRLRGRKVALTKVRPLLDACWENVLQAFEYEWEAGRLIGRLERVCELVRRCAAAGKVRPSLLTRAEKALHRAMVHKAKSRALPVLARMVDKSIASLTGAMPG